MHAPNGELVQLERQPLHHMGPEPVTGFPRVFMMQFNRPIFIFFIHFSPKRTQAWQNL